MKVLVLGGGGREHALAWRLTQDASVDTVMVWPGNSGMKELPKLTLVSEELNLESAKALIHHQKVDLVVIGPEKYLFVGWVDQLKELGVAVYGPSQAAAFLEKSKIESKIFMRDHAIETAAFEIVHTLESAFRAVEAHPEWQGYVLKLSGPALGKGVIVTRSQAEAKAAAEKFFQHRPPGIEEGMVIEALVGGREVSLFYVCDGENYRFLASACDHKRLKDQDQGPNTGGMGAYSPCYWIDENFLQEAEEKFVKPTLIGMKQRGTPFTGTLFLGLMVSDGAVSLLEYNVRFGDPETQTFLPLLEGDFAHLLLAAARGNGSLAQNRLSNSGMHALHVVKAAKGYPGLFGEAIEAGVEINTDETKPVSQALWFFAGVKEKYSRLYTSGGRVCGVTGVGTTLAVARANAYANIQTVHFEGEQFRRDIGGTA